MTRRQKEAPEASKEKLSIYLPADLAQDLRIAAVKERRTISAVVEQLIRDWLAAGSKQ